MKIMTIGPKKGLATLATGNRITVDFAKPVPAKIARATVENMERFGVCLSDAFRWAARDLAKQGSEVWNAWYYDDCRAFIPQAYRPEALDFAARPLAYENPAITGQQSLF